MSLLLLVAASFTPLSHAQWAHAQAASAFVPDAEQQIMSLVNQERQSRGLAPLAADERLTQAARLHSQRMAAARQIGHQLAGERDLSLRLGQNALRFDVSGENVAVAGDAARAHTALMNSPHHRANILDRDFNSVGIGVVRTDQGIFVTQDFAHRLPLVSVEQAEEEVAMHLSRGRSAAGAPALKRVPAPELRRRACQMAATDRLDPRAALLPGAASTVAFTADDLSHIPDSLQKLRPANGFSVGACYQSSASYETPVFWIIVVTYL
jgi:uncharacterized protein YkwD